MRLLLSTIVPVLLHVIGYALVFAASMRTSSFVGLIAISAIVVTVPVLLLVGLLGAQGKTSLTRLALATWTIAVAPPGLLLLLNKLVT